MAGHARVMDYFPDAFPGDAIDLFQRPGFDGIGGGVRADLCNDGHGHHCVIIVRHASP